MLYGMDVGYFRWLEGGWVDLEGLRWCFFYGGYFGRDSLEFGLVGIVVGLFS